MFLKKIIVIFCSPWPAFHSEFCTPKSCLQFKETELYWCPAFFKDLFTQFYGFWSQIGVAILVTPKQEMEQKKRVVSRHNFFYSNLKVEW